MRTAFIALALSLVASPALAEQHYNAKYGEIFINKVVAQGGSHAFRGMTLGVKLNLSKIDGKVVEVGFRNAVAGENYYSNPRTVTQSWNNMLGSRFYGDNYYTFTLPISSDFGYRNYEGVFYAKTDKGTFYWAKPALDQNFRFDGGKWDIVNKIKPYNYSSNLSDGVETTTSGMGYFNPGQWQ